MTPKDILKYGMNIPPPQFPLIAHFVKWLITSDDVELSKAFMVLDGSKYNDGLFMSYLMQVHDMLMMRRIEAVIAADLTISGEEARIWVRVDKDFAMLWFTSRKENE